ncbi:MAG: hypothetical protein JSS90_03875 [Bacteroidetes bacterium]|jgi:hypothetical protein|nr:hypothetical protein [Bacteroidota bacterium]
MKERLFTGWNIQRAIYVLLGGTIIIQSAMQHEWFGLLIGGYFASMGLFAFGCAAGNCFNGNCTTNANNTTATKEEIQQVKQ